MGTLFLRDVEDDLIRTLKTKAKVNGTSLQHEAKTAMKRGAPPTGEERRRILEEFRRKHGGFPKVATSGGDLVREMREEEG